GLRVAAGFVRFALEDRAIGLLDERDVLRTDEFGDAVLDPLAIGGNGIGLRRGLPARRRIAPGLRRTRARKIGLGADFRFHALELGILDRQDFFVRFGLGANRRFPAGPR